MDHCQNALIRILMQNDGSMTLALESLLRKKIIAKILRVEELNQCDYFSKPVILREVFLESEGKAYLHAISYTTQEFYTQMGFGTEKPIGLIMRENKISQLRDVYKIENCEIDEEICEKLEIDSILTYKRQYFVYVNGLEIMHLTETVLPALLEVCELYSNS